MGAVKGRPLKPWNEKFSNFIYPNARQKVWVLGLDGVERLVWRHRHYVELALGRDLTHDEYVIHLDGDGSNNKLENLYLAANQSECISICMRLYYASRPAPKSNIRFVEKYEHNLKHSYAQLENHYGR